MRDWLFQKQNGKPYIIGISIVKNEEDVIEQFVRHNLYYLDLMVIINHNSVDKTRDILHNLEIEGLHIITILDKDPQFDQKEKTNILLKNLAVTLYPDFIIPLDSDEFIKCRTKAEFIQQLEKIPRKGKGYIRWETYIISEGTEDSDSDDIIAQMTKRRKKEIPQYKKVILRLSGRMPAGVSFTVGNHDIEGISKRIEMDKITLGHFPVRSKNQIIEKTILGWMAYLIYNPMAREGQFSYQRREIFDLIKKNHEFTKEELLKLSIDYAQEESEDWHDNLIEDPMTFKYEKLKYLNLRDNKMIGKIARSIEQNLAIETDHFLSGFHSLLHKMKGRHPTPMEPGNIRGQEIFQDGYHLYKLFFDIPPFEYLYDQFQPTTVLDIGCGIGHYLLYLQSRGAQQITGIDGISHEATLLKQCEYIQLDLNNSFQLNEKFDLVIIQEVFEHLTEKAAVNLMKTAAAQAGKFILFSAAQPGQPGIGHINCKPISFWLKKWSELGWEPLHFESLRFRILASFSFLKRNPVILAPNDLARPDAKEVFIEISKKDYTWWQQENGIITTPLNKKSYENL